MKEYIGITGYKFVDEINAAKRAYEDAGITKDCSIGTMFGFLVSESQAQDATREGKRNPSLQNLAKLLKDVPDYMLPTMHYCSRERNLNVDNLAEILHYDDIGHKIKAIQLNLDWPSAGKLAALKISYPNLYIIQQVNPNLPEIDAASKVMEYKGLVDKLLIDPSLGAGIAYDIAQSAKLINHIAENTDKFSYVVCGGLDKDNVYNKIIEAKSFVKPAFSIDAEGRLRTSDGRGLNLDAAAAYINNAARAMLDK